MSKKLIFTLIILTIILSLPSCGKADYNNFESKFMELYYAVIQNVDSKEVDDILKKLQSDENAKNLDAMDKLLQVNKDLQKSYQKEYDEFRKLYIGLIDLKAAYGKWDSYDLDKQDYLNSQLNYIYVYIAKLETEKKLKSK